MSNTTTKKKRKKKINKDKEKFYVDKELLVEKIKKYYETDELTDDLALDIKKIAEGLSYASNFINYSYRSELVGDAIEKMIKALIQKKYNINNEGGSSPFSYFTTIAFNAFINRIKKEKKDKDTLHRYQEKVYEEQLTEQGKGLIYNKKTTNDDYDFHDEYLQ